MRRLLVTGASGFLGGHLGALLAEQPIYGYDPVAWDRRSMGDLLLQSNRERALREVRPQAVLHLAWSSTNRDDYEDDPANALWGQASSSFLIECIQRGIRFMAIGSAADLPEDPDFDSPYSSAKRCLRLTFEGLQESSQVTWLRPQYIVSFEDKRPRVVRAYLQRKPGAPFKLDSPDTKLDFVHVADVASGIRLSIENDVTGIVELGSGSLHSVSDLITAAERWTAASVVTSQQLIRPRPSLTGSALLAQLGWRPTRTQAMFADTPT